MSRTRNDLDNQPNFYDVLGVDKNAPLKEIKDAYHNLARETHPDKNPNNKEQAEKAFKLIQEAYATLSDPEKRRRYDIELASLSTKQEDNDPSNETHTSRYHGVNANNYYSNFNSYPSVSGIAIFTSSYIMRVFAYAYTQPPRQTYHTNINHRTALHYATKIGNFDWINALLANGSDINAIDNDGMTALNYAIALNNTKIIHLLLSHGADISSLDSDAKDFCLYIAAASGLNNVVKNLLQHGAVNKDAWFCDTPLHIAVQNRHSEVVRLLVSYGADSNETFNRMPMLSLAAKMGDCATINALLDGGANINTVNEQGITVLHEAVMLKHSHVVKLLLSRGASYNTTYLTDTLLPIAVKNGDNEMVHALLNTIGDINVVDKGGTNLLHRAVISNNSNLVNILLQRGANINAAMNNGLTPIIIAAHLGFTEISKLLLGKNPDLNIQLSQDINTKPLLKKGDTALHVAVLTGHLDIARMLIKKKANINATNYAGQKPIDVADANNKLIVKLLTYSRETKIEAAKLSGFWAFFKRTSIEQKKSMLPSVKALKKVMFDAADPRTLVPHEDRLNQSEFAPFVSRLKK